MGLFDFLKVSKYKNELESCRKELEDCKKESVNLKQELSKVKLTDEQTKYLDLQKEIASLNEIKNNVNNSISELTREMSRLISDIEESKKQLINLEEEQLMQEVGFYNPKYDLEFSEQYRRKLNEIRDNQKSLVKNDRAVDYIAFVVNGSTKQGNKMAKNNVKFLIRAFNAECDAIITKVKFNNIEKMEERIRKCFNDLNKLNELENQALTNEYYNLKLEELYLVYEYEQKKREEYEEQQRIKEQIREEQKALKELEAQKQKLEKEETHFLKALQTERKNLEKASDKEKEIYEAKIRELEEQLNKIKNDKENVIYREQNTRAGYVYIISNIGSFGENVYKIGMTRRLEPMDRVKELSDASVPFTFDVHALIFSEDAPKLENELHKAFTNRKVNMVNDRKEFFKVTLEEIERVVKENHNKTVEFTKLAQAEEYRISKSKWAELLN